MKKLYILFTIIILHQHGYSQSVGVGTTNPNSSAALDVSSNSKGMLVPRIYLQSAVDNSTIQSPATSLLLYNTNSSMTGGTGMFYNAGTAASPNWTRVGDLVLPYYKATSSNSTSAFRIENYSGTSNSTAIYGFSQGGIGVYASSGTGTALETNGKVKFAGTGQSPQQGKVLTSDANGNATWEGAVAFNAYTSGGNVPGATAYTYIMPFSSEAYDLGDDYNTSTHKFTVPVNGIYHFEVLLNWGYLSDDMLSEIQIKRIRNGSEAIIDGNDNTIDANGFYSQPLSCECQLQAGDIVFVIVNQNTGDPQPLSAFYRSSFSGRLVIKL